MTGYLLDTDVLSESSRLRPDPRVLHWLELHDPELHLSTISLGEIAKGVELLPAGKRRRELMAWSERIERWASGRLLAPDAEVMREWGRLCARHERKGRRLPVLDSLIAATALHHRFTLATGNTGDHPPEIPLLNPWKTG